MTRRDDYGGGWKVLRLRGAEILYYMGTADGAYANGARVTKVAGDDNDSHDVGKRGTVVGSMIARSLAKPPARPALRFMYFVEWDAEPGMPVAVVDWKIASHAP